MLCTGGNTTVQGNIASIPTHNFHNKQTVVCFGRITNFIDGAYSRVHSRIKTNGEIRTVDILIYRARQTNAGNIKFFAECIGSFKRPITTNNNQAIDLVFFNCSYAL